MRKRIDAHVHITPGAALGKVNKRFGTELMPYGRMKLDDAYLQVMPCYMHDSQFTDDALVNMMDFYGVDKAVVLQSLMNEQNEAIAAAVEKHPDRLVGAMVIEPNEGWRDRMGQLASRGLSVIKFEMRSHTKPCAYPNARLDDPDLMEIFDESERLGLTITIDPAPVDFPVHDPSSFEAAVSAHPKANFVLCHLGYPLPIDSPELFERWHAMVRVARRENCWIDVSALPDLFDEEGWPYPTALGLLSMVKEELGADKLIWGSDITGTLNRATYPQMIDMFERHAGFSDDELDALFYENATAAYRL